MARASALQSEDDADADPLMAGSDQPSFTFEKDAGTGESIR